MVVRFTTTYVTSHDRMVVRFTTAYV